MRANLAEKALTLPFKCNIMILSKQKGRRSAPFGRLPLMDRKQWLDTAVFYEIYPTSFFDSDGDGVGDVEGIIQKLDYVAGLGCNGIWLNPLFCSPFRDGGYDVADYKRVDPRFGTNEDLVRLFKEAKKRGVRILLDLVPGHTSDTHPWFKKSAEAERNGYSDYYIWSPNVWTDARGEGLRTVNGMCPRDGNYAVNFFSMQPALNYGYAAPDEPWQMHWQDERLLPLRREIEDVMRFWLSLGCAGFRVDMAASLVKNDADKSATCALWREMFSVIRREFPEAVFVSEWSDPPRAVGEAGFDMDFFLHFGACERAYMSLFRRGADSVFARGAKAGFTLFFDTFEEMRAQLCGNGFLAVPGGNHDMVPRLCDGKDEAVAKAAYAFLCTLPSVPFFYYGDEIGMTYQALHSKDGGYDRTGSRTPMRWGGGKNAGFSQAETTYLPMGAGETAESMEAREGSLLHTVRALSHLRRAQPALAASAELRVLQKEGVAVYEREGGGQKLLVAINPNGAAVSLPFAAGKVLAAEGCTLRGGTLAFTDAGYMIAQV